MLLILRIFGARAAYFGCFSCVSENIGSVEVIEFEFGGKFGENSGGGKEQGTAMQLTISEIFKTTKS